MTTQPSPPPKADSSQMANATIEPHTDQPSGQPTPDSESPSYVKLAMRNMVKKRGKSLMHFALTTFALLGFLIGVSYLTR